MAPTHDYFYRYPAENIQQMTGRCRVRVYERNNGSHIVLLTELNSNSGESITSACDRIATALVETKKLRPTTTRWIQHEPPYQGVPEVFDELRFDWKDDNIASDPKWQRLTDGQVEAMIGENVSTLSLRIGESESDWTEKIENE